MRLSSIKASMQFHDNLSEKLIWTSLCLFGIPSKTLQIHIGLSVWLIIGHIYHITITQRITEMSLVWVGVAAERLLCRLCPPSASPVFVGLLSVIILHWFRSSPFTNSQSIPKPGLPSKKNYSTQAEQNTKRNILYSLNAVQVILFKRIWLYKKAYLHSSFFCFSAQIKSF